MKLGEAAYRNKHVLAIWALAFGFGTFLGSIRSGSANTEGLTAQPFVIPAVVSHQSAMPSGFAELVRRVQPSVVQIAGIDGRSVRGGSGVIVDPRGYILTNEHVVGDATRIRVKLSGDPSEYNARLIGADPETDLAVIRIDAGRPLAAAVMGNSDAVQVGDWAIAVGAPFGLHSTVTAGIISAKGRDLGDPEHPLQSFIQTDAAINHGNSGGPLLNVQGEVIGINTKLLSDSGSWEGMGFALPINLAAGVYNQLVQTGKVSRGALGISFNTIENPALLKAYGATEGCFVQQVAPGGPAERAGIRPGDVIVGFSGAPVRSGKELLGRVAETAAGSRVPLMVLRDGRCIELTIKVGDRATMNSSSRQAAPPCIQCSK